MPRLVLRSNAEWITSRARGTAIHAHTYSQALVYNLDAILLSQGTSASVYASYDDDNDEYAREDTRECNRNQSASLIHVRDASDDIFLNIPTLFTQNT